jgi:RNA polymerase sigma factor (sigma-70 family)
MLITEAIKHRDMLVNRASQIVGADNAEDVVQDLFEYLIKTRMNAAQTPEKLLMWYIRNRAIQHLRKVKRTGKHEVRINGEYDEEKLGIYADRVMPDLELLGRPDRLEVMLIELDKLDPFLRQLFILVHCDGLTLVEVGRRSGIPVKRLNYIHQKTVKYLRYEITSKEQRGNSAENDQKAGEKRPETDNGIRGWR